MKNQKKHERVLQIIDLMNRNGISLSDISEAVKKMQKNTSFDLLCNIDGALSRVSFEKGKDKNPIGIFPFKDSPAYIELLESSVMPRCISQEVMLPTAEFFEKIFAVKKELNSHLNELHCHIIEGEYFAAMNMLVSFDGLELETRKCAPHESAKIRYFGVHM